MSEMVLDRFREKVRSGQNVIHFLGGALFFIWGHQLATFLDQSATDMEFVKNFTHPDFQAKSFTPQKCVICDIFFTN